MEAKISLRFRCGAEMGSKEIIDGHGWENWKTGTTGKRNRMAAHWERKVSDAND